MKSNWAAVVVVGLGRDRDVDGGSLTLLGSGLCWLVLGGSVVARGPL